MTRARLAFVCSSLGFIVPMRLSNASCMAPASTVIYTVEVRGCEPFDPRTDPQMKERVEGITRDRPRERRSLMQRYRGAMVDAKMGAQKIVPVSRIERSSYDAVAYPLAEGRLFAPGHDNVCEHWKVGAHVRVYGGEPCCDGDPGVPCLFDRAPSSTQTSPR